MALLNNTPQEYYNDNDYGNYIIAKNLFELSRNNLFLQCSIEAVKNAIPRPPIVRRENAACLWLDMVKSCFR